MTTFEKLEELIYKGFKETDRKIQETDRKFQEIREQELKAMARDSKKTDKKLRELANEVYGLTGSVGRFAEQTVQPAMIRLFAKRGIELTGTRSRSSQRRNGGTMEVDVLGVGPKHVVAIEVKFRLELQDVNDYLEKLPDFFDYFEEYRDRILYGGVAGLSIDSGVDRFAYRKGLFVLAQSGENVRVLNDEKFRPHLYKHSA